MEVKEINPIKNLSGFVQISGAKNSALLLLAAAALARKPVILENLPNISDVQNMCQMLELLNVKLKWVGADELYIDPTEIRYRSFDVDIAARIRTSILFMGVLLGRFGHVKIRHPGGCSLGQRPVDFHIEAMKQMGASVVEEKRCISGELGEGAGEVYFERSTVTGTANALLCAVTRDKDTVLHNCAMEPEVDDLIGFLRNIGAEIRRVGSMIVVKGGAELNGGRYRIMSDRIEAGTFLIAAVILQGSVKVGPIEPVHLKSLLEMLKKVGAEITVKETSIELTMSARPKALDVTTGAYPAFPTDLQPQWSVLAALSEGNSRIVDKIYPERFDHMKELANMGVQYQRIPGGVLINGVETLHAAELKANNLRAAAALVLAAMAAQGKSSLINIEHLYRGYSGFFNKIDRVSAERV